MISDRDPRVLKLVNSVSQERVERTVRTLASFPTRHTLSGARGADAAAAWLEKELRSYGGRLEVKQDRWTQPAGTRMTEAAQLTNVVALLPGTQNPERILVVSGHYDSRVTDVMNRTDPAPGANDDASGVAVVLECARLCANERFPISILFAAVTGEEQGLLGATHLVEMLAAQGANVVAMATNDIVGNSKGESGVRNAKEVRVFSAGYEATESVTQTTRRRSAGLEAETIHRSLARTVSDTTRRYVRGFSVALTLRNDRYGRGGDHSPFVNHGWPAIRFTEPNEDWKHQHQDVRSVGGIVYGDLPDNVDYAYLTRVTKANVAWLTELASAPEAPRVTIKLDLSPATTLSWSTVSGAEGYEVLWRKTTQPDWTGRKRLGKSALSVVLPLSKDDFLFAVRSVGASGARSLAASPR